MRSVWNIGFFRRFKRVPDASPATEAAVENCHLGASVPELVEAFEQLIEATNPKAEAKPNARD